MTAAARMLLVGAQLALAALYVVWFHDDRHRIAALLVFALPPLLLAMLATRHVARFWSGVLALGWFSHGVMAAWSTPERRMLALVEIVLALLVIGASSWPGLQARWRRKRAS